MKGGVMRQMALLAEALSKHPPLQTVVADTLAREYLRAIGGLGAAPPYIRSMSNACADNAAPCCYSPLV